MSAEINQAKHKLAKALLVKFSFLFPLPKETNVDAFVAIWRKAIEDLDEALVLKAADNLLLTMTRFPYPADLRAEVKALQAVADVKPINIRHKLIRSVRKARCRSLARNELPQKSGVIAEIDFSMLCDECVQWALLEGTPISHFDLLQTILTSHAHQVEIALRATRLGRIRLKIASILLRVAGRAQCI